MELDFGEYLICPHCSFQFDETVDELKLNDGYGAINVDKCECGDCGLEFTIIRMDSQSYEVKEIEDEDTLDDEDDL